MHLPSLSVPFSKQDLLGDGEKEGANVLYSLGFRVYLKVPYCRFDSGPDPVYTSRVRITRRQEAARMAGEQGQELRDKIRSLQHSKNRTRPRERIIPHPETGERARELTEHNGDSTAVITSTDNRQDVQITPRTHVQSLGAGFMTGEGQRGQ